MRRAQASWCRSKRRDYSPTFLPESARQICEFQRLQKKQKLRMKSTLTSKKLTDMADMAIKCKEKHCNLRSAKVSNFESAKATQKGHLVTSSATCTWHARSLGARCKHCNEAHGIPVGPVLKHLQCIHRLLQEVGSSL